MSNFAEQGRMIFNLWQRPVGSNETFSYWLLLINALFIRDESDMVKELVFWKESSAKYESESMFFEQKDELHRITYSHFGVDECPSLIIGAEPYMHEYLKIPPSLLHTLLSEEDGFILFCSKVHNHLKSGRSLDSVKTQMTKEKFWKRLKIIYEEVKPLIP